ncbi:MAG: hypothetical protein IRZ10_10800 [Thermoflavifilum sp.]|nr:hypothetical protein [Thermoflavifilum sp.]MCL6514895.1 hypothetical protein [Alicyclobacillus sp.]
MTMQARIEAFYRQSGGPHNPQIQKILERHLLYAKDHGPPGKRETIEDAFIDTVIKDPSNLVILKWIQQARLNRQRQVGSGPEHVQRLERELQSLRKEVAELKQLVQELSKRACALHDSE